MSIALELHRAHQARQQRIAERAYRPPAKSIELVKPKKPKETVEQWAARQVQRFKEPWFHIVDETEIKNPKVSDIQRVVCRYFSISKIDLISPRRDKKVTKPRMLAVYLCRRLTIRSLPEIGQAFGDRDHTTILHSVRKVELRIASDASWKADLDALLSKFGGPDASFVRESNSEVASQDTQDEAGFEGAQGPFGAMADSSSCEATV